MHGKDADTEKRRSPGTERGGGPGITEAVKATNHTNLVRLVIKLAAGSFVKAWTDDSTSLTNVGYYGSESLQLSNSCFTFISLFAFKLPTNTAGLSLRHTQHLESR